MPGKAARARRRQAIDHQNLQRAQQRSGETAAEAPNDDEAVDFELQAIQIGPITIIGAEGELFGERRPRAQINHWHPCLWVILSICQGSPN